MASLRRHGTTLLEVCVGVDNAPVEVVLPAVAAVVLAVAADENVQVANVPVAAVVLPVAADEKVEVADVPVEAEPAPVEEEIDVVFILACSSRCNC